MAQLRLASVGLVICGFLWMTSAASALILGVATPPTGGTALTCGGGTVYWQSATDLNYDYSVPVGGGEITSWSTYAATDVPGSTVAMVVLRPTGSAYTVVAADTETIPGAVPVSGVATFNLSQPIVVATGDVLGISSQTVYGCGLTPASSAEVTSAALAPTPPSAGTQYMAGTTFPTLLVNLSANLVQNPGTPAAPPCQVTTLAGAPLAVAKTVLTAHNCKIGTTTKKTSKKVPKGLVISTTPGPGSTLAAGTAVSIVVSSGSPKHKKTQKHKAK
ncbi:MAG: PASTA domain-containing protein [Actinomycetota bacterium]|nr:PASTA domain-containing protein [Actinomycetota bacterium]